MQLSIAEKEVLSVIKPCKICGLRPAVGCNGSDWPVCEDCAKHFCISLHSLLEE